MGGIRSSLTEEPAFHIAHPPIPLLSATLEWPLAFMSQMMTLLDHIGIPDDDEDNAPSVGDRVPWVKFGESFVSSGHHQSCGPLLLMLVLRLFVGWKVRSVVASKGLFLACCGLSSTCRLFSTDGLPWSNNLLLCLYHVALARLLLKTVVVLCFVGSWSCVSSAALLAAVALAALAAAEVLLVALSALALRQTPDFQNVALVFRFKFVCRRKPYTESKMTHCGRHSQDAAQGTMHFSPLNGETIAWSARGLQDKGPVTKKAVHAVIPLEEKPKTDFLRNGWHLIQGWVASDPTGFGVAIPPAFGHIGMANL